MQLIIVLVICFLFITLLLGSLFLHEMSHAYTMKRCRIKVNYVKVGVGPVFYKFRIKGILVILSLFPCASSVTYDTTSFHHLEKRKRLVIDSAGILMNFAVALIGWGILYMRFQLPVSYFFNPIGLWNELERILLRTTELEWRLVYFSIVTLVSFNSVLFMVNSLPIFPCDGESLLRLLIPNERLATIIGIFLAALLLVLTQGCSFKSSIGIFSCLAGILFLLSMVDYLSERKKVTVR